MRAPAHGTLLAPRHQPRVLEERQVPSDSTDRIYTVRRFADGTWDCDCKDYTCRQRAAGGECKHITREKP